MTTEIETGEDEHASDKTGLQIEFAEALGAELDSIGYPAPPKRTKALAQSFGFGRTQAFRLLKGDSAPSVPVLAAIRAMGISLDRLIDSMTGRQPSPVQLRLGAHTAKVLVQPSPTQSSSAIAVPDAHGVYELRYLEPGQAVPKGALRVGSLHFTGRHTLALIEDDATTLELLGRQLQPHFAVSPFSTAKAFFAESVNLKNFDLVVMDWRLPDQSGLSVIQKIRETSQAPIFILTGDTSSADSIAQALDLPNVHHVAKPAAEAIFLKRLHKALEALS